MFVNVGTRRKYRKYLILNICPILMNGYSTGHLPIHLNISHDEIIQKNIN